MNSRLPALIPVLALTLVSLQIAACGVSAPVSTRSRQQAATPSGQWQIEPTGQLGQVQAASCPTTKFCIVIDRSGFVVSKDGGLTWGRGLFAASPKKFIGSSVSCPSSAKCVVAGVGGPSLQPTVAVSTDAAGTWRIQQLDGGAGSALNAVACPTESFCVTAGSAYDAQLHTVIYVSRDGGSGWGKATVGEEVDVSGIACASDRNCMAVGYAIRNATNGPPAIVRTDDGGHRWTSKLVDNPPALDNLTCATNGRCLSVGLSTRNIVTAEPVIFVQDDATHSFTRNLVPLGVAWLNDVSCGTPLFCVAVGYASGYAGTAENATRIPAIVTSNDGGKTWRREGIPSNVSEVITVACQATLRCIAGAVTNPFGYVVLSRTP